MSRTQLPDREDRLAEALGGWRSCWRRGTRLAALLSGGLLAACDQGAAPVGGGQGGSDPYASGVSYPWTQEQGSGSPLSGDAFVSDLAWTSARNSWGPVEKDRSNGTQNPGDGAGMSIGARSFAKGLGVHAASEIGYALGGKCSRFTALVGVDDEVGKRGSVTFQVWADGSKRYDSAQTGGGQAGGALRGGDPARSVSVDLGGVQTLRLVVTDAGDGISWDHADWADAQLSCQGSPPPPPPPPPAPTNSFDYQNIADQPQGVSEAQGLVLGGLFYSFGGFDSLKSCCTPTNRAYRYDPSRNLWTRLTDMPDRGVTHAGMTSDGRAIYYAGGYVADSSWTAQVFGTRSAWRYDPAADSYARLPDLPTECAAGQLAYLDGKLHLFGGTNPARTQDISAHYVLDLAAGSGAAWKLVAPLPQPRNHLGAAVLGGRIYAIGGQTGHDAQLVTHPEVFAYDPSVDSWTRLPDLPRARSHISNSTFVMNGRIVVAGGETAHDVPMADVNAYDPLARSWSALSPLPTPRVSGVADVLNSSHFLWSGGGNAAGWKASAR